MSEPCAECGFVWETPILESFRIIEELPGGIRSLADHAGPELFERPEPQRWSIAEYVWHLADLFHLSAEWMHDIRTLDHPTHYAIDTDALTTLRGYNRLPLQTGLWSLEQSCRLFVAEAAITDPSRSCYYHDWQDVTAGQVVSFLTHEAVHHLFDVQRALQTPEVSHVH